MKTCCVYENVLLDPVLSRLNPVHAIEFIYLFIYLQLTSIFGEDEGNKDGKYKGQGFPQSSFPYFGGQVSRSQ